ncbi:MAG: shikimate kinase [Bacteroidales bacterium]
MNIYLIGFMGSGKSSAGRRIAALLRWKFRDTDKLVEREGRDDRFRDLCIRR